MTHDEIERKVIKIIADYLEENIGNITVESRLINDLALDSLGVAELAFELEEKFELEMSNKDLSAIKTVKEIVDYIFAQKKKQAV